MRVRKTAGAGKVRQVRGEVTEKAARMTALEELAAQAQELKMGY